MKKIFPPLVAALLTLGMSQSVYSQSKRAMWVWNTGNIINNVSGARQALFDFCSQPPGSNDALTVPESSQPITVLYFYAHSFVSGDSSQQARLRSFLRDAHVNGIEIEFLDGASDWATTGKGYALTYLDHVLNFNANAASEDEKFDGIQYDVEPYLLEEWFTQDLWESFMDLAEKCQAKVDSASGARFGLAIPRWYDIDPGRDYLAQLQSKVDYVAVMNYTDRAANMIADAANEVAIGDSLGKQVVLGSETALIEPASVTFAQEGWSNMEARLYDLHRTYQDNASFAAIAIHDYDAYRSLTKYGTDQTDATAPYRLAYDYIWTSGYGKARIKLVDICGTGVSTSGSTTGSKVTINGSNLNGSWASSEGYLSFSPSSTAIRAGGPLKIIYTPKDASGNSRHDTVQFYVAAQPVLVSPANNAKNQPLAMTLKWRTSAFADAYRLQLSTNSNYSSSIVDTILSDTTFSLSGLQAKRSYYWRVFAANENSATEPSASRSFTTKAAGIIAQADDHVEEETPTADLLSQELTAPSVAIYPNPARISSMISVKTSEQTTGFITLHAENGALVKVITDGGLLPGETVVPIDVSGLAQGSYFVRLMFGDRTYTRRLTVTR